jgi:hypothetical protein
MTQRAAAALSPALGGLDGNPNLTRQHWDFAWFNQHAPVPDARAAGLSPAAGRGPHFPVAAPAWARTGQIGLSFSADWYHRIHIRPQHIDMGNIASTQTVPLLVWNAWFQPRTLEEITGLAEGIELTGQPDPPQTYPALGEKTYHLSVTPEGQTVLDIRIVFQFDSETPGVRVTANRIVTWGFPPNWSDSIIERLTWATDIMESESRVEQRRALRPAPRREFEAEFLVAGRARQFLDLALFSWGARVWVIPVWPEVQRLQYGAWAGETALACQTGDLEFHPGGLALLTHGDPMNTEVMEIAEVDNGELTFRRGIDRDWPPGAYLYPARTARLIGEPSMRRETGNLTTFEAAFAVLEPSDVTPAPPEAAYRGRPLLDTRPDETETLTHEYARLLETLDSGLAAAAQVTDVGERALPVLAWRAFAANRRERAEMRALLYWLAGRHAALWVPAHADDLTVVDTIAANSTAIDVAWCGVTRFAQARNGRRDIRIELRGGGIFYRRITAAAEISAGIERLSIDAALGIAAAPADIIRVSWLSLMRGSSDTLEIEHITDSNGPARVEIIFRGVRDDEF